jgi:hypothetical protein
MRETTSETVYPHPWHLVFNAYNLRYPTHERLPLLLEVKEISNKFELREGCDECVGGKKKQQKLAPAPDSAHVLRSSSVQTPLLSFLFQLGTHNHNHANGGRVMEALSCPAIDFRSHLRGFFFFFFFFFFSWPHFRIPPMLRSPFFFFFQVPPPPTPRHYFQTFGPRQH